MKTEFSTHTLTEQRLLDLRKLTFKEELVKVEFFHFVKPK